MNSLPGATRLGTSAPGTAPAVELTTSADDDLTFELAAKLLDVAREQFVSDYERHGESVAVYRFKQQVSHWSNQFPPEMRGTARTVGNRMDGETHEFKISQKRIMHWHEQDQGERITKPTLIKYERAWAGAGGLEIIHNDQFSPEGNGGQARNETPDKENPDRLGKDSKRVGRRGGKRMNGDDSSTYRVDFSKVIKKRRTWNAETGKWSPWEYYAEPWDFRQIGPESQPFESASLTGYQAESSSLHPTAPQLTASCQPVDPYCSPPVSDHGSDTASLTVPTREGENVGGEDLETDGETSGAAIPPDPFNTYLVRTYKSGKQAYARLDRVPGLAAKGVASEKSVALSADEAAWMWWIWPAESPERTETRQARIAFLLATEDERAALIAEYEAEADAAELAAEREREAQAAREERERQEKAEQDRAVREAAKAEFDRRVPELEALIASYNPTTTAACELSDILRMRDPRDRLPALLETIEHFRTKLAARQARAPLAARCLEHIRVSPSIAARRREA